VLNQTPASTSECSKDQGKREIDLTQDPPPDLVVEIDITSSSQFQIYATLGVPELWRYDERELQIYQLREQQYLPLLCDFCLLATEIPRFLEESQNLGSSDDSVFPSLGKTTFKLLKIGEIRE